MATSKQMRENPLFMRNNFDSIGKWGIPIVKKQFLDTTNIQLLACSCTKSKDSKKHKKCGIHFFVDDYRFEGVYNNPDKTLNKFIQYSFLLTPDFSTYADMQYWRQLESVAKSRWVGAFWQSKGLTVIPTVSWSTPRSFEFCFDGIEYGSIVAVGMIGCKMSKANFMHGYNEMLNRIQPSQVIVLGDPFPEMQGNLITIEYSSPKKGGN